MIVTVCPSLTWKIAAMDAYSPDFFTLPTSLPEIDKSGDSLRVSVREMLSVNLPFSVCILVVITALSSTIISPIHSASTASSVIASAASAELLESNTRVCMMLSTSARVHLRVTVSANSDRIFIL